MGAFIVKNKHDPNTAYSPHGPMIPTGGLGPDGILRDPCIEGILNLENRLVTNDAFTKISSIHQVTKQVLSLSLANNRITALIFDESAASASTSASVHPSTSSSSTNTHAPSSSPTSSSAAVPPLHPPPSARPHHTSSTGGSGISGGGSFGVNPENAASILSSSTPASLLEIAHAAAVIDEEDAAIMAATGSTLGGGSSEGSSGNNTAPGTQRGAPSSSSSSAVITPSLGAPKPPPTNIPLRSSTNWPILENLDLSGNNELFNYEGLGGVNATLRSLRLANNGIFKVPREVWTLVNLTKLDLSHNRLLVLPPGIGSLGKLNSLKLSHNSLSSTSTSSSIPEEMKFCARLRRLDLSHNKLRELPVNFRVDREHQQRRSVVRVPSLTAGALTAPSGSPSISSLQQRQSSTAAQSQPQSAQVGSESPPTFMKGGSAFKKLDQPTSQTAELGALNLGPSATQTSTTTSSTTTTSASFSSSSSSSAANSVAVAPIPIKYFDPNRISYIQITLLNLSNNQIDSLSPSIGLLRSLNSLNLGYNKLRSLPTEIALLNELKYLDLRFNQLPSLLTEICQLPRLSKLCLQNNKISALPYEIKKLKKLTHFFISSNQLVDLPDVIAEIRNVRVLKLCNNKLLTIPDSMFRLQKLRLLDLSFNKLTYISPDVCTMPLIEDLRLWGNKLSDIPGPILYSDVKKIINYLKATERERCLIANQMRSLQGPRSYSRAASVKSTPLHSRNRAHSATRAASQQDHRFAPLGFYNDDEDGGGQGSTQLPSSSRSAGGNAYSVPRAASASGYHGARGSGKNLGGDSGSDAEDGMGSDDEFTSMFRTTSRTGSFTNLAANVAAEASRASSGGSSRRSATQRSPIPSTGITPSPRDANGNAIMTHTTIVQPFQSSPFSLGMSITGPNSPHSSNGGSGRRSLGGVGGGVPTSSGGLQAIHDRHDDDEEDEDGDDVDDDMDEIDSHQQKKESDVLTDLVRRDWKPAGASPRPCDSSGIPPLHPSPHSNTMLRASSTTSNGSSARGSASSPAGVSDASFPISSSTSSLPSMIDDSNNKDKLMEEWDMQSMAIEKQHQTKAGSSSRQKVGAKY